MKRSFLEWLSPCGTWFVHPMFIDGDPKCYAADYCRFLGVSAVTDQSFVQFRRDRSAWLTAAKVCQNHLLIDPDKGVPFDLKGKPVDRGKYPAEKSRFLRAGELVEIAIAKGREDKLTLVYDQSSTASKERSTHQYRRSMRSCSGLKERISTDLHIVLMLPSSLFPGIQTFFPALKMCS